LISYCNLQLRRLWVNGESEFLFSLQSILWNTSDELIENKIKFNYRGKEHVGDVIVDSENENDGINDPMYLTDKALGRVCFAHNIEPSMSENASYVADLSKDRSMEKIRKGLRARWNYVKENPQITLSNIQYNITGP
jgi:hypothetical protein